MYLNQVGATLMARAFLDKARFDYLHKENDSSKSDDL